MTGAKKGENRKKRLEFDSDKEKDRLPFLG